MDANKAMVVEDIAMDVFMSGPFLQWVSACNFFLRKIWQTFEDLKTNFSARGFMKWRSCFESTENAYVSGRQQRFQNSQNMTLQFFFIQFKSSKQILQSADCYESMIFY